MTTVCESFDKGFKLGYKAGKLECNIAFRQIAHIIERIDYIYKQQKMTLGNGD